MEGQPGILASAVGVRPVQFEGETMSRDTGFEPIVSIGISFLAFEEEGDGNVGEATTRRCVGSSVALRCRFCLVSRADTTAARYAMPTTVSLSCSVLTVVCFHFRGGLSGWDMPEGVQAIRRDHDALVKQVAAQGTQQATDNTEVC